MSSRREFPVADLYGSEVNLYKNETYFTQMNSAGFNVNTRSTSLRIIILVVLIFGLLMLNSYSAVLVSRLAVDKVDILFPTLESIIERNTHVLCVRESSFAYRLFKVNIYIHDCRIIQCESKKSIQKTYFPSMQIFIFTVFHRVVK